MAPPPPPSPIVAAATVLTTTKLAPILTPTTSVITPILPTPSLQAIHPTIAVILAPMATAVAWPDVALGFVGSSRVVICAGGAAIGKHVWCCQRGAALRGALQLALEGRLGVEFLCAGW